jgi:hypothetical protein
MWHPFLIQVACVTPWGTQLIYPNHAVGVLLLRTVPRTEARLDSISLCKITISYTCRQSIVLIIRGNHIQKGPSKASTFDIAYTRTVDPLALEGNSIIILHSTLPMRITVFIRPFVTAFIRDKHIFYTSFTL